LWVKLIETRALFRQFKMGSALVAALDGVDLEVERGELLAIVGVSGSGKSTLLHVLGGLDSPTSGSVLVDGSEIVGLESYERAQYRRRTVGFVFQSFHLVPSMTAYDNVAVALTFQGTFGAERRRRARQALERVGLGDRMDHRPAQLSGGEQQRVAVARAIVHRPPLLLADEPTGNLDERTASGVIDLIQEVRERLGTTVIKVTHDEAMAARVADRVIRLRDGRIEP
jgi:putative ABC transport system ATP-binding protein